MSSTIGHFEIVSELAKSATSTVYKANDSETGQTVALKAIQLSAFGPQAAELAKSLAAEAEASKVLSHSNLPPIRGAAEIDGQFCAAMEYIQGNSIATMLARKEGFSIWDLLDIGRQICSGLDHAHSHQVFHYSLEPAKIMCGWDGGVRVLSFGLSSGGRFTLQIPGIPPMLYYMSPEQIRGEQIDGRSNFFSVGAMFYEMVTDQKLFECEDSETLRQMMAESAPTPPIDVNPKIHPALNELILKALAKDPNERYQNGRELLDDLEKCKETKPQAAKAAAPKGTVVPDSVKAANQAKFIGTSAAAKPAAAKPAAAAARAAAAPVAAKTTASMPARPVTPQPTQAKPLPAQSAQSKAAAATPAAATPRMASTPLVKPPSQRPAPPPAASMSTPAVDEPAFEAPQADSPAPKITVDPMMAEDTPSTGSGISFSDMTELPPLKEVYIEQPPPPPAEDFHQPASHLPAIPTVFHGSEPEKPKVQPREIAEKAVKEIKNVPPRLVLYSIAGAAVVILAIAIGLVMHINSLNSEGGDSPRPVAAAPAEQPQPAQTQSPVSAPPAQPEPAPAVTPVESAAPTGSAEPETRSAAPATRGRNSRRKSAAAPTIVTGELAIDSNPQGAQVQIDGRSDPSWVTPLTLSGVAAGQHAIVIAKAGYTSDSRNVNIASGNRAFFSTRLNQLTATLAVSSSPAGANVYIDGKDTGKLTPAQVQVTSTGTHVVLVRKSGYIDESTNAQFTVGQTVSFTPTLRALGNVDDMRTSGKMKKLFGGKDAQGMGAVSVKTQPKGAQVAINEHMVEKDSPVEVMLDPGNYIVDITMTGYAPIHKVVSVDKGGKVVIDEVMQRQ